MFLQPETSQVPNPTSPPASVPNASPSATSQSPVHNRTDEEKAAEAISDDVTDEDKAVAEQREEVQKKVSARIFSGLDPPFFLSFKIFSFINYANQ